MVSPKFRRASLFSLAFVLICSCSLSASGINIILDYSYDTNDFFGAGNPDGQGPAANAALIDAADFFSDLLSDTFSSIETPPDYQSQVFNGEVTWNWNLTFSNPNTGLQTSLVDQIIAEDEYRLYVGARSLAGTTLGQGGPGGWGWSSSPSGGFTSGEITELEQISADFGDAVETRGEPSGFAKWGGAVTFDSDASTDWHYDHNSPVASGKSDFYSVALHEIGHALGLNGSDDAWNALQVGAEFQGPAALAAWKAEDPTASPAATGIPTVSAGNHHWKDNEAGPPYDPMVSSYIVGTTTLQEAAMDPSITTGDRKLFTNVDALALQDIGWEVTLPPILGDMNGDGSLTNADISLFVQALTDRTAYDALNLGVDADVIGDVNSSGYFDLGDVGAFKSLFPGNGSGSGSTVPEPSSLLLAAVSVIGLGLFRRHAA